MPVPKSGLTSFDLQARDVELLHGLLCCRVMTVGHVASLYFEGRSEAAKKRLQKLKAAGLIGERPRRSFEPAILYLSRKGFVLLGAEGVLQQYPQLSLPALEKRARVSDLTISHELEVMDCKVAFQSAVKRLPAFSVAEFNTWPALHEFTAFRPGTTSEVIVRPDGFIRLHEKETDGGTSEHAFYIEVDRSTETQDVLVSKAHCYLSYYRSGGFAEKCGGHRSDFKDFPFRVLMAFKTAERRNNTAERLLTGNPPILTHVWLTTMAEATADPFGPIWVRPADYRATLTGTPFEAQLRTASPIYSRQGAREQLVEAKLRKKTLIGIEGE